MAVSRGALPDRPVTFKIVTAAAVNTCPVKVFFQSLAHEFPFLPSKCKAHLDREAISDQERPRPAGRWRA